MYHNYKNATSHVIVSKNFKIPQDLFGSNQLRVRQHFSNIPYPSIIFFQSPTLRRKLINLYSNYKIQTILVQQSATVLSLCTTVCDCSILINCPKCEDNINTITIPIPIPIIGFKIDSSSTQSSSFHEHFYSVVNVVFVTLLYTA